MIHRRGWLQAAIAGGMGLAGSGFAQGQAQGQEPETRRTARKPAVPVDRAALRPVLESWEVQPPIDPRVEAALRVQVAASGTPGMIGAIVDRGAVAAIGAVGVRGIGASDPIRATDQVHLGSCTKAMTATMIGTLFEDRLLQPNSRIADLFPDEAARFHPDHAETTLWQLLTHRAGLPHDADWWRLPGRTTTDQRRAAMVQLLSRPATVRPGTFEYSNAGYVLAGLMAERAAGQPWEQLMQERLFVPLNMRSAGYGPPGGRGAGTVDQPSGHHLVRGRLEPTRQDNAPCMGPAGTVHCTVLDWAKFAVLHARGERADGRLLTAATFRQLHAPPKGSDYAGGWGVSSRSWAGGRALSHLGSNTYWYAAIWIAPARDRAFLVAANRGDGDVARACDSAVAALIGLA